MEVEETLQAHPAVADAAVVGVRTGRSGLIQLKAFVVRSDEVSRDALIHHARVRLSMHKVPTLIEFRDTLPRSSAGKLLRGQLAEDA